MTNASHEAMINNEQGDVVAANIFSLFHASTQAADAKAFTRLMSFLKVFEGEKQTVIMVQVENEPGVLGDTRDRSPVAEARFDGPVAKSRVDVFFFNRRNKAHSTNI